jgi:hypothetical protein
MSVVVGMSTIRFATIWTLLLMMSKGVHSAGVGGNCRMI